MHEAFALMRCLDLSIQRFHGEGLLGMGQPDTTDTAGHCGAVSAKGVSDK